MYLSTSLSFLLLPLGAIAGPQPKRVLHGLHQNSQRVLPSIPLATNPSLPLKTRAGILEAGSDANPGAVIRARQIGELLSLFSSEGDSVGIAEEEPGPSPDNPKPHESPDEPETPASPRYKPSSTSSSSLIPPVVTIHRLTSSSSLTPPVAIQRPTPSTCPAILKESNYNATNAINPFEVQDVSILPAPDSTFDLFFTDRLEGYNSGTVCYVNASCSIPFPGLQLQVSINSSSISTNATSYATFTDLPSGDFVRCSRSTMGLSFFRINNQTDTVFLVQLMHVVSSNATVIRYAGMLIDLNAGPQTPNWQYVGRSNIAVGSENDTWTWLQASDAWYTDVASTPAPLSWVGDVYSGENLN